MHLHNSAYNSKCRVYVTNYSNVYNCLKYLWLTAAVIVAAIWKDCKDIK